MLKNLKLIFIHGVSATRTDYAQVLFENVLSACHQRLEAEGKSSAAIAFDYIWGFRKTHALNHRIKLHSFITMGSPIPIFTSAMGHPDSDIKLPASVGNWTNIRSPRDGVARPLQPFFRNLAIQDHLVSTRFLPIAAHNAYWTNRATANIIADQVLAALG
jgi:hypothetical protein